jgi:hypothetical protein
MDTGGEIIGVSLALLVAAVVTIYLALFVSFSVFLAYLRRKLVVYTSDLAEIRREIADLDLEKRHYHRLIVELEKKFRVIPRKV